MGGAVAQLPALLNLLTVQLLLCSNMLQSGAWVSAGDLAGLMTANVELRRLLYTDTGLCADTLDMVLTAQAVGAAAKFCGSGGAAVACCPAGASQAQALQGVNHGPLFLARDRFFFLKMRPHRGASTTASFDFPDTAVCRIYSILMLNELMWRLHSGSV